MTYKAYICLIGWLLGTLKEPVRRKIFWNSPPPLMLSAPIVYHSGPKDKELLYTDSSS